MAKRMKKVNLDTLTERLADKLRSAVGPIISDWKAERDERGIHGRKKVEKAVAKALSQVAAG